MDLETFVTESLCQIAKGIRKANKALMTEQVGQRPVPHFVLLAGTKAADRTVAFDVAVTTSEKDKGGRGIGLRIYAVNANVGKETETGHQAVSRLQFRVHVDKQIE
jgi:hypothetical protein